MLEFTYMFCSHKTLGGKWRLALIWGHLPAEWVPWYRPPAGFLTLPRCNFEIYPPAWRAQPSRKHGGKSAIWLPKSLGSSVDRNTFELFSRRFEESFRISGCINGKFSFSPLILGFRLGIFLIFLFSISGLFLSPTSSYFSTAMLMVEVTGHKPELGKSSWLTWTDATFRNCCNLNVCIWDCLACGPPSSSVREFQLPDSSWHGSSLLLFLCKNVRRWREKGLIPCGFSKQSSFFPIVKDASFPMRNTALMT